MKHCMPCVGLLVFLGCFTVFIAPDPEPVQQPVFFPSSPVEAPTVVVIDPGHGGNDEGARRGLLKEKDIALDVAQRVARILKQCNVPTWLTREEDVFVSLPERTAIANQFDKSVFISIHCNDSRSRGGANGVETYYADQKVLPGYAWTWVGLFNPPLSTSADNGETLASYIQAALIMRINVANRGIKSRNLYVVRNVYNPAVLVEVGFLSNSLEAQSLANADYREKLAAGIAEGALTYYKTRPRAPMPTKLANAKD
jgi:N-acetylmuramoyl-L-alanine amidase